MLIWCLLLLVAKSTIVTPYNLTSHIIKLKSELNHLNEFKIEEPKIFIQFVSSFLNYVGENGLLLLHDIDLGNGIEKLLFKYSSMKNNFLITEQTRHWTDDTVVLNRTLGVVDKRHVVMTIIHDDSRLHEISEKFCADSARTEDIIWMLVLSNTHINRHYFALSSYQNFLRCKFFLVRSKDFMQTMRGNWTGRDMPVFAVSKNVKSGKVAYRTIGTWNNSLNPLVSFETCCLNLTDMTFRVGYIGHKPYSIHSWKKKKIVSGICYEMILEISRMFDFKVEFIRSKWYGKSFNNTWNGMIGSVYNNNTDLAMGIFSWVHDRMEVVSYLPVFIESAMGIAYKPRVITTRWAGILYTMRLDLWFATGTTFVILSLLLLLKSYLLKDDDHFLRISSLIMWTSAIFGQQGWIGPIKPVLSHFVFALVSLIFGLFIQNVFTTTLTSAIASPQKTIDFHDMKSLLVSKLYQPVSTIDNVRVLMKTHKHIPLHYWNRVLSAPNLVYRSKKDAAKRLSDETVAFYDDINTLMYNYRHSDLEVIEDPFQEPMSMIMQKNSPYYSFFKKGLLKIRENGVLNSLRRKYLKSRMKKSDATFIKFGMEETKLLFVIILVGILISLIISVLVNCLHRQKIEISMNK